MAVNEEGRLYFSNSIDNNELKKGAKEASDVLKNIGDKAISEGERIDKAYKKAFEGISKYGINSKNELVTAIEQQKQAIAKLEEEYGKVNAAFYDVKIPANPDDAFIEQRQKALKLLSDSGVELNREKATLEQLEKAYQKLTEIQEKSNNEQKPEKVVAYRTQIQNLTNEMARLRESGQKETEEYKKLEAELKRVGTAYNEVSKEKKLLTTGGSSSIAGIMSGISGIAGAFSAGQGALSLFTKDNERLAAIQTKLQAVMAITIGLQQVSNTLHATSAFRIKTVTQVTQLWTGAINRLSVALGISRIAAQALMGALTMGLSVAIGFAVDWLNKYIEKQKKAKEEQDKFAQAVADNSAQSISAFEKLKKSYEKLGDTINEKTDFVIKNQSEFKKLGVEINNVNDADNLFIKNAEAFKNSIIVRAQSMAAMELASEKYKEVIKDYAKVETENLDKIYKKLEKELGKEKAEEHFSTIKRQIQEMGYVFGSTYDGVYVSTEVNAIKAAKKQRDSRLKSEGDALVNQSIQYNAEFVKKIKDANIKSGEELKEGSKEWWEAYRDFQQNMLNKNFTDKDVGSPEYNKIKAEILKANQALKTFEEKQKPDKNNKDAERKRIEANRQKVEAAERKQRLEEYTKTVAKQVKDSEFEIRQSKIDALDEGFDKEKQQIELNYDKLVENNKRLEEQWKQELKDHIRLKWENENPNYKDEGKIFDFNALKEEEKQLNEEQTKTLKGYTDEANKYKENAEKNLLKALLEKYRNYEQQRTDINKKFDEERKAIENSDKPQEEKDKYIERLEKGRKDALKAVNNAEIEETKKSTDLFVRMFADASLQSVKEIRKVIDEVQELYDYLSTTKTEDITANFGFDAEYLKNLKENAEQLKAILNGLIAKKKALADKSEFQAFYQSINDGVKKIKKGLNAEDSKKGAIDISDGIDIISESIDKISPKVKKFGEDLSVIFGDSSIGENIAILTDSLNALGEVASGVGNIMSGKDIAGGVTSVISGMSKIFSMASAAEKRHQQALEEIAQRRLAIQREYNLLLLQQNLLLKEAVTIFGEREIVKAANAVRNYGEAISQLEKEMKGNAPVSRNTRIGGIMGSYLNSYYDTKYQQELNLYNTGLKGLYDAQIVTGHKKTGMFGLGKGKDTYSSIMSVYKDVITAEGKLNTERIQAILNTQKMKDKTREYLENLLALQKQAEEAQEALRNYLEQTFGELGSGLMDSIVSSIQDKGVNAWEKFGETGAKVIEKLGNQLAYELFFADKFDALQKQLEKVYETTSDPEDIARRQLDIINSFYNNIGDEMDAAQKFMEEWKKKAEEKGFNLWEENSQREATAKGFASMSQDSANELNGRFTAVQAHTFEMNENLKALVAYKVEANAIVLDIKNGMYLLTANSERVLNHLAGIESNTKYCENLIDINKNIAYVKTGIDDINLKGLRLRQ